MNRRCVALISGGLDSALAASLMLEQGIEVHGLYLSMSWGCCEKEKATACAQQLGIPLMVLGVGDAYLDVIRSPKYGYGSGMNPCIDCRIYMFRIAKRYMEEVEASFVVTGEVLDQRPMSQRRRPLELIEAESDLEGLLLRPLSARSLEPTLPELYKVVDRQRLLQLSGRSRQAQMEFARQKGIRDYSTPAGGCLLTDDHFAAKVRDLFVHEEKPTTKDMELLTIGRHFRIDSKTKIILGRNALENLMLEGHAEAGYTCIRPTFSGPSAMVVGEDTKPARQVAVKLIVMHTKPEKLPETMTMGSFWINGVICDLMPENLESVERALYVGAASVAELRTEHKRPYEQVPS